MSKCFGYIRVSTQKQGAHGVSLQEQKDAIARYASRNGLAIAEWFEERETAAKAGRPVFTRMLQLLRAGKARGVVLHKIDRGARNLKDWANLGELLDENVDIHLANESLDLRSRGGRLSADIQAVVAADFIRNLREETRKGFYGRLKQGMYPLPAPIGYTNQGKGQPKAIDPLRGPLVRQAFELYATQRFTLETLAVEMKRMGLVNGGGRPVGRNSLSLMLNNPFYTGLMRIRSTGELFPGAHEAIVSRALFRQVQQVLNGKAVKGETVHNHLFRGLFQCGVCGRTLTGERQKGHIYYRCHHAAKCSGCVREEAVDSAVAEALAPLHLSSEEKALYADILKTLDGDWAKLYEQKRGDAERRLGKLTERTDRLTDAYLDGVVDAGAYQARRGGLLQERRELEEFLARKGESGSESRRRLEKVFELAGGALLSYEMGTPDEKRDLLKIVSSNRTVSRKNVAVALSEPFLSIANREVVLNGAPCRDSFRTFCLQILKMVDPERYEMVMSISKECIDC